MQYLLSVLCVLYFANMAIAEERALNVVEKNHDSRKRVALVIGNGGYKSSPLKNPVNDAHAMAATLRRLGFEVDEKTNLGFIAMNKVIEGFGKRLKAGGVGLFYYAGHGMQVQGSNYLLPVDTEIEDENEVRFKAVDAGLVLAKMEQARGDVNLVVLDACRNNPFARSFRSATRGLASMDAPSGSMIAYATAPGKTAADGTGKNGVYTEELIRMLETPGLTIEEAFKRARKAVMARTNNAQVPWESSSLTGDFHFVSPSEMTNIKPAEIKPTPVPKSEIHQASESDDIPGMGDFSAGDMIGARKQFEYFINSNPGHQSVPLVQYYIGKSYFNEKDYEKAILAFQVVIKNHSGSEQASLSMLDQAMAFKILGDQKSAKYVLKRLLEKYPQSEASNKAREMLNNI